MSSQPKATFYELCRLCLESPGVHAFKENNKLINDIYCFTGIKVATTDNLPQTICKQCKRTIKKMKALQTLTKTNDAHLRFLFDDEAKPSIEQPESPGKEINSTTTEAPSLQQILCKQCGCHKNSSNIQDKGPKNAIIAVRKDLFTETTNSMKDISKEEPKQALKSLKQRVSELTSSSSDMPPDNKKVKVESSLNVSDYKCDKCNKTFTDSKKFYHHQRQHNRSVMCPFDACLKKFTTRNDLAKHVRTHTGEKPFKCSFCEKRFTQKVTMKQHELCHYKAQKQPKANY